MSVVLGILAIILEVGGILALFVSVVRIIIIIDIYSRWKEYCKGQPYTKLYLTWKEFIVAFPYMKNCLSCYSNFMMADFKEDEVIFYRKPSNEPQVIIFSFLDYLRFKFWERNNIKGKKQQILKDEKEQQIRVTLDFLKEVKAATEEAMLCMQ